MSSFMASDEVTITIEKDDAYYLVVAIREQSHAMRKMADQASNLRPILTKACDHLDRVASRIEKELENA